MKVWHGLLVRLALLAALAPACAAAQGHATATEATRLTGAALVVPPVPIVHGTKTLYPGVHEFTACTSGCTVNASPGQSVPVTFEAWGGGGSGASGQPAFVNSGAGGGGGGGGGYGKSVITVVIPISSPGVYNKAIYSISVGRGGGGVAAAMTNLGGTSADGENGMPTTVTAPNGAVLVSATGGKGGAGDFNPRCARCGGASGGGGPNGWGGTAGYPGGLGATCNGGAGGLGGAGGGPGRSGPGYINDGGNGGTGGNVRNPPKCLGTTNFRLESGLPGGDGRAVLSW